MILIYSTFLPGNIFQCIGGSNIDRFIDSTYGLKVSLSVIRITEVNLFFASLLPLLLPQSKRSCFCVCFGQSDSWAVCIQNNSSVINGAGRPEKKVIRFSFLDSGSSKLFHPEETLVCSSSGSTDRWSIHVLLSGGLRALGASSIFCDQPSKIHIYFSCVSHKLSPPTFCTNILCIGGLRNCNKTSRDFPTSHVRDECRHESRAPANAYRDPTALV